MPSATCVAELSTRFSVQDLDSLYWITGEQTVIVDSNNQKRIPRKAFQFSASTISESPDPVESIDRIVSLAIPDRID